jgi:SAM-dependent methyltransferase
MLKSLERRANKAGLADRIDTRLCPSNSLGLDDFAEKIDFALAFAVAHEVPDSTQLLREIYAALKPAGRLLLSEPKGHVSKEDFDALTAAAEQTGFKAVDTTRIVRSHTVVLEKKAS